jgi:3-phenylpropionate/trans-cinnamate dioxygenase ferredoxin reductase subunit
MNDLTTPTQGPDLATGVPADSVPDGATLLGHVGDEAILLAHTGGDFHAVGATCTHYGAPLADGLVVEDTIRCPWHHACFSLRTGDVLRAPALRPLARWRVERRGDLVYVTDRLDTPDPELGGASAGHGRSASQPDGVVIIGAGAAGSAAAETLRREGYDGRITMVDGDPDAPYDRPNLSKDYLAGSAPETWIPLRAPEFYSERGIELLRGVRAMRLDVGARRVALSDGSMCSFDRLLLATGAEPARLPVPLHDGRRIHYLRTLRDSRAIIAAAAEARRAVVLGASFIGLEVAASLRARGLEVHVVAPEPRPLERVMGPELGDFIRDLHEQHGVVFHLGRTASSIDGDGVALGSGERLPADLVVAGVGVRPNVELAAAAGLVMANGVEVDEYLETSASGVFAAGDIARWPDPRSGRPTRVEHWVVAERQGQTAARNMLGARERFDAAPFFWSAHYDVTIAYVGHAERPERVEVDGDPEAHDCTVRFFEGGRVAAVATIGRDDSSLRAEVAMERELRRRAEESVA